MRQPLKWQVFEECGRRYLQRISQTPDVLQSHVPLAPLYGSDVGAVQPGEVGEGFLAESPLFAMPTQLVAKGLTSLGTGLPQLHND